MPYIRPYFRRRADPIKAVDIIVYQDDSGNAVALDGSGQLIVGPSNDHAAVIQAAIDYLANRNGGKIYVREGTYTINTSITPKDNVTIEFNKNATIKLSTYFLYLDSTSSVSNFELIGGKFYITQNVKSVYLAGSANNITIKDAYFGIDSSLGTNSQSNFGLKFDNVTELKLEGITIDGIAGLDTNVGRTIEINGENINIISSKFIGYYQSGTGQYTYGIYLTAKDVLIAYNHFKDWKTGAVYTINSEKIKIIGNVIEGGEYGIRLEDGTKNVIIEGNMFIDVGSTSKGSIFTWGSTTPVYNISIASNVFRNEQKYVGPININYTRNVSIVGNLFEIKEVTANIVGYSKAINLLEATDVTIEGNVFYAPAINTVDWSIIDVDDNTLRVSIINNIFAPAGGSQSTIINLGGYPMEEIIIRNNIFYPNQLGQTDEPVSISPDDVPSIIIEDNVFLNSSPDRVFDWLPSSTKIRKNYGFTTENSGTATLSGDGTTTDFLLGNHGLSPSINDPTRVLVKCTPASADAIAASPVVCYLSDEDADGIYESIRAKFASAPAAGTNNVKLIWKAEYM